MYARFFLKLCTEFDEICTQFEKKSAVNLDPMPRVLDTALIGYSLTRSVHNSRKKRKTQFWEKSKPLCFHAL